MTDATEKHLSVSRQDVAAIIEDIRLGCPETAIKHLGAMLAAAPIANPVMSPGASGIASVNDVLDIIDGAIVRLEELGSPPGDVMRMELEDAGKFLSLTKATPAEPVAWQYRLIGPSGPTKWRECNDDVRAMIAASGHYDGVNKVPAELRPLYADIGLTLDYTAAQLSDLLRGRDNYIVSRGLWGDFVDSLPAISEAPTSAEAVKTSPDVGEMVERLNKRVAIKGMVYADDDREADRDAASLLISLDAERGRLAELADNKTLAFMALHADMRAIEAERERLREALRKIEGVTPNPPEVS